MFKAGMLVSSSAFINIVNYVCIKKDVFFVNFRLTKIDLRNIIQISINIDVKGLQNEK